MSTLVTKNLQIGADGTASNNFTVYQPVSPDGTLRIGNGNSGTTSAQVVLTSAGNVGIGTSSPGQKLVVNGDALIHSELYILSNSGSMQGATSPSFYSPATGTLGISTNGVERMRIDSAGRVTMPFQPAFRAGKNNANPFSGGQTVTYNSVDFNVGSHYNSTTGAFTAPVAGRYLFAVNGVSGSGVDDLLFTLRVNGVSKANFATQPQLQSGQEIGGGLTAVLSLAANDAVTVFTDRDLRCDNADNNFFCGYLIG